MATIKVKNSVTSGSNPSGLTFGELAVNITDKKIYIGNAVGSTVTLHDQNNLVTSINGATGAITNIAQTDKGNTFSVRQVMNAGITSANIYITSGATFSNSTISIQNDNAKIDGTNSSLTLVATNSGFTPVNSSLVLTGADVDIGGIPSASLTCTNGLIYINAGSLGVVGITGNTTNRGTFTSTGLGTFNSGISASAGSTFTSATVYITNSTANVDPLYVQHSSTGAFKVSTTGLARTGAIKLGNSSTATLNTFISQTDGTLTFYNGISATGSNMINFNTTTMNISPTIAGATFSGLITSTSGISASGGATFGGNIYAPNIVTSVNGITGIVGISAGSLINISQSGKTLTISSPDTLYGVSGAIYASCLATGLLHGGIITINAGNSGAFDITAGRGQIHITGATFNADPLPTLQYIDWTAKTGVTLSGLTSSDTTWLYFDNTGTLRQQSTYYTDQQIDENIIIGALVHPTRSYISLAKTIPNVAYATDKQYEQFIRLFGPLKQSGHTISANGANLKLNRSSGSAYILGRNWINDPNNPTTVTDNAQTDCTFWRYYRGATAGTFVTVLNQTAIDPDNYDDGSGTLQTVPSNRQYTIQRLFYFPGTPSVLGVYYGRGTYASMPDAAANIQFEDFAEIDNTKTNAISVGYIIVKKSTTDLTAAIAADDCRIIQSGIFRSTVSGGGSIATKLDDLTDVTITSVSNDDVLIYDTTTSQWLNTPLQHIGVSRFNGLTGEVTGVASFNGSTGAVVFNNYVSGICGATGAITLTAGSNMTITKSGNIFTFASSGGGGGSNFTYSSSAPGTPADGDRWMDSDTGKEYIYVNDGTSSQWIEPVSSNGLVGVTYTSATNVLQFGVTGSFAKLGVNTTSPQFTLDVNGIIHAPSGISAAGSTFSGAVISDGGYRITSNAINAQTGTTYTLLSTDNGKIITMNNGSTITLTVPSGLPIGFNTTVIQLGSGQVGITSSSTTLNSFQSKYNLAGQHAAASIISYTTNVFNVAGGLTG